MSYPFIIWTLQRTGGTALTDLLMAMSEHPSAEHEPFNWSRDKPRQFWLVASAWNDSKDVAALGRSLDDVCSRHVLIKHCHDLFNMEFNAELAAAATREGYRHILLLRRDEGSRLISKFVAEAQGTWFKDYAGQVYAEVAAGRRELQPLPVDQVVAQYHHARRSTQALRRTLQRCGSSMIEVSYEDLYRDERGVRAKRFGDILGFLGFGDADQAAHRETFEQATKPGGQATFALMRFIPNIEAVVAGLAAAGLPPGADFTRRKRLGELKAQISAIASARRWILTANLDEDWPGFSLGFDQASSLAFRIESADMSFGNVYFGIKNKVPIHNKSLDEALNVGLGPATYSDSWPWCRHPNPDDDILPIEANWAVGGGFAHGVASGTLAAQIAAAAETMRGVLGASGYIAVDESEWARLQRHVAGVPVSQDVADAQDGAPRPAPAAPSLFNATYLGSLGLEPATVIDVGVLYGTPALYDAFGGVPFVLVDPQRGAEAMMKARPQTYRFVNKALGSRSGWALLSDEGAKSGLLERTSLTSDGPAERYEVEVTTLDAMIEELGLSGTLGLKVDAEGYELEILRGLVQHADRLEFVICETSVRKRFKDGYAFGDLVALMRDKGFGFYNFLDRPQTRPLFYDLLFLRMGHRLFN